MLRGTLESKEKGLQEHLSEVGRLRQAEEEHRQAATVEGDRLRVLAGDLTGEVIYFAFVLWYCFLIVVFLML